VIAIITFFSTNITYSLIAGKAIETIYKHKEEEDHIYKVSGDSEIEFEPIQKEFTIMEKLSPIWWMMPIVCCFQKTSCLRNNK